jgi:hypothetical protein
LFFFLRFGHGRDREFQLALGCKSKVYILGVETRKRSAGGARRPQQPGEHGVGMMRPVWGSVSVGN